MRKNEEEASVRSRESVDSLKTMGDTGSTENEAQRRRTAWTWARSERALEGERERIQAGVLAQSMEGDGMDPLWRVMNVIEGDKGTRQEAEEVRDRVMATVEERWKAGELKKPLPPGETGWQVYIQRMVQGRRMGGPPEVEARAMGGGYRVRVYRETEDGAGYRKIREFAEEKGVRAGIPWKETRVLEVVWEQEGEFRRSTAREGGDEDKCRGAPAQPNVGSENGHRVTSSDSCRRRVARGVWGVRKGTKWNSSARRRGHVLNSRSASRSSF